MLTDLMTEWLRSARPARINGTYLRPVEHPCLKDVLLFIERGQAGTYPLAGSEGVAWILKVFHAQRSLDRSYLIAVSRLLPSEEAFRSGTARHVLSSSDLRNEPGCYYKAELARWLDGTLLMPRAPGMDWATLADDLREGIVRLDIPQRVALCRGLCMLIDLLEQAGCSHRDLSAGNVFIVLEMLLVYLIDFDSFYHPSLAMPAATTCGTVGYTPPFAWRHNDLDARHTWCPYADRYALALLNVEFLLLESGSPLTAEGGIFDQDELRARSGPGLSRILADLRARFPAAAPLLAATLESAGFDGCPSPQDWTRVLDKIARPTAKPPALAELETIAPDYFAKVLRRSRPAAPLWPAPSLEAMPLFDPRVLDVPAVPVQLPPDPWRT